MAGTVYDTPSPFDDVGVFIKDLFGIGDGKDMFGNPSDNSWNSSLNNSENPWEDIGSAFGSAADEIVDVLDGTTATEQNAYLQGLANAFTDYQRIETQKYNAEEALKARNHQTYLQKLAQEFNRNEAEVNRLWQTQMSNTAYQRAFADMKEAGLNPFLAYAQGGAPVSSSQSASVGVASSPTASVNTNAGKNGTVGNSAGAVVGLIQNVLSTALGLAKIWK